MRARRLLTITAISLCLFLVGIAPARAAIDCIPGLATNAFMEATVLGTVGEEASYDLIIVGTVTSVTPEDPATGYSDIRVHVEVVFKGDAEPEITLPAVDPLPTGVDLQSGTRYFIVAGSFPFVPPSFQLEVYPCGPTQPVERLEVARLVALSSSAVVLDASALPDTSIGGAAWVSLLGLGALLAGLVVLVVRRRAPPN